MELKSILATDCGSTTTKAILIQKINGEYRLSYRGEAPTTVEAPFECCDGSGRTSQPQDLKWG